MYLVNLEIISLKSAKDSLTVSRFDDPRLGHLDQNESNS